MKNLLPRQYRRHLQGNIQHANRTKSRKTAWRVTRAFMRRHPQRTHPLVQKVMRQEADRRRNLQHDATHT